MFTQNLIYSFQLYCQNTNDSQDIESDFGTFLFERFRESKNHIRYFPEYLLPNSSQLYVSTFHLVRCSHCFKNTNVDM